MIIHEWDENGRMRDVELSPAESLVKEIHENLMERGIDQGTALLMIEGSDLETFDAERSPVLQAVLSDVHFRLYLAC